MQIIYFKLYKNENQISITIFFGDIRHGSYATHVYL